MHLLLLLAYSASSVFYSLLFNYYITCMHSYTVLQSENQLSLIPLYFPLLCSKQFKSFAIQIHTTIFIQQTPCLVVIPLGSPPPDSDLNMMSLRWCLSLKEMIKMC